MAGARRTLGKLLILVTVLGLGLALISVRFLRNSQTEVYRQDVEIREMTLRDRIHSLEARDRMASQPILEERTIRIEIGDSGYRKPVPAAEGGYDVEPTLSRAASRLVGRMLGESRSLADRQYDSRTVHVRPESDSSKRDVDLALRIAALLRRNDVPAVQDFDRQGLGALLLVADRELGDFGRVIEVREGHGGGAWSVLVDREMRQAVIRVRDEDDVLRFGFKTDHQTQAAYAREDAFEGLQRRLSDEVWRFARDRLDLAASDEGEFRTILAQRFPGALLADLGQREFGVVRKVLEGPESDDVLYQADVSWAGDRRPLRSAAQSVAGVMRARARAPFVRGGLALGALVLAVLGWLKADWWLKGRHAFLSKVAFVILALLGVALSLQVSFHV